MIPWRFYDESQVKRIKNRIVVFHEGGKYYLANNMEIHTKFKMTQLNKNSDEFKNSLLSPAQLVTIYYLMIKDKGRAFTIDGEIITSLIITVDRLKNQFISYSDYTFTSEKME